MAILVIILSFLTFSIIGFIMKWSELLFHPEWIFNEFHLVIENLFSIFVVYEFLQLFRTLSPNVLMEIVLLVLARKIVLSSDISFFLNEVIAFVILLIVRLIWQRFGEKKETA
jgi:hypothetical protein